MTDNFNLTGTEPRDLTGDVVKESPQESMGTFKLTAKQKLVIVLMFMAFGLWFFGSAYFAYTNMPPLPERATDVDKAMRIFSAFSIPILAACMGGTFLAAIAKAVRSK